MVPSVTVTNQYLGKAPIKERVKKKVVSLLAGLLARLDPITLNGMTLNAAEEITIKLKGRIPPDGVWHNHQFSLRFGAKFSTPEPKTKVIAKKFMDGVAVARGVSK